MQITSGRAGNGWCRLLPAVVGALVVPALAFQAAAGSGPMTEPPAASRPPVAGLADTGLAATGPTVTGTLRAAGGARLAGAMVELHALARNYERALRTLAGEGAPPPVASAVTDDAGRFAVAAPSPGVYRLVARAEGRVPMEVAPLPLVAAVEVAPVVLQPDAGARVRVLDAAGEPAAGAWVYAAADPGFWRGRTGDGWQPALRLGRTGAGGLLALPRGAGEGLELSGWAAGAAVVAAGGGEGEIDLRLPAAPAERELVVAGAEGRPEAGVIVGVGDAGWPAGTTDSGGRLRVRGSFEVPLPLLLFAPDGRVARLTLDPPDARIAGAGRLRLAAPRTLAGRVLAAPLRTPLGGALIWPGHDPGAAVRAGRDGRDTLVAADGEPPWLQAEAAGFLPRAVRLRGADLTAGRVPALLLEPAVEVRGSVVDAAGRPLAGAELSAAAREPTRPPPALRRDSALGRAIAGADGSFALGGLAHEGGYTLRAALAGYRTAEVDFRVPAARLAVVLHPARRVFGHAVGPDQRPLAGVEVRLRPTSEQAESPRLRPTRPAAPGDPEAAVSGADGRFELAEAPASRVDLEARREGYAPVAVRGIAVPEAAGPADLGTIVMVPGAAVEGRVTGTGGRALAGASVWIALDRGRETRAALVRLAAREDADAVTGADGRFRIPDLAAGSVLQLRVEAAGHLPATLAGVAAPTPLPLAVRLEPAAEVRGVVVERGGGAVPGARVTLRESPDPAGVLGPMALNRAEAVSGERGEFTLAGVAAGSVEIEVAAEGYVDPEPVRLEVAPGRPVEDVRFELVRGAVVAGRVSDAGGEPVEGARIAVGRPAAVSDAEGIYRLEGVPTGAQRLVAVHEGFDRLEREVAVELGVVTRADLVLTGGWPVAGRTVTVEGAPLGEVTVELVRILTVDPRRYRALSDAGGRFTVPRVADGRYLVEAGGAGHVTAPPPVQLEVAGAAVEDVEVRLEPAATVWGRVLGLDLDELAAVTVEASDGARALRGVVGSDGGYEIAGLGPGDWRLTARLAGGRRQAEAGVTVERGGGRVRRDLEFEGALTLTGRVTWGGEPLPGAGVTLAGLERAVEREVTTDVDGRFRIADLSPGRFHLDLLHRGEGLSYGRGVDLAGDLDLAIEIPTARVSGTVVSAAGGGPVEDAMVMLHRLTGDGGRGALTAVATDRAGAFRVERLSAGGYRLSVQRPGYSPLERPLEVEAGTPIDGLELEIAPTEGLELIVRLASGGVPPVAAVAVLDAAGNAFHAASQALTADGAAWFGSVPAGSWTLLVSAPGGAPARAAATVPGDPVAVTLPDAGRLRVRVPVLLESNLNARLELADAAGRPFEGADPAGLPQRWWPVTGGIALVDGLPAGAWTLRVTAGDGRMWTGTAATLAGHETLAVIE